MDVAKYVPDDDGRRDGDDASEQGAIEFGSKYGPASDASSDRS